MVGAKVNGKLVDPDHILANAEVVEILTYDGQPTALSVSRHHVSFTFLVAFDVPADQPSGLT